MADLALGSVGWVGAWSRGLGLRLGLVAVLFYLVAAWRCAHLARGKAVNLAAGEAIWWWVLGGALLALGLYKLLDLQTALAAMGRAVAIRHQWYTRRYPVQLAIIAGVGVGSAAGAAFSIRLARKVPTPTWVAAIVGVALVGFVAVRTVSFHAVDLFLDRGLACLKINWLIELGGVFTILASIQRRLAPPRAVHRKPK